MNITNEKTAKEFLAAWNYAPRKGILNSAIDGLRLCLSVTKTYNHTQAMKDYAAALRILESES